MMFFNVFFSITSSTLPLTVLNQLGYNSTGGIQTEEVRLGLALLIGPVSGSLLLLSFMASMLYPITEVLYQQIRRSLEDHKRGLPAIDPITLLEVPAPTVGTINKSIQSEDDNHNLSHNHNQLNSTVTEDLKWLLFHFALWEVDLTRKFGVSSLLFINMSLTIFSGVSCLCVGFLWGFFPIAGEYYSYVVAACISFVIYFGCATYAAYKLMISSPHDIEFVIKAHLARFHHSNPHDPTS
eukprot:TRINITY_DN3114_c0_g1_i9.p1 TRINITY_DN3114_c0_g1~~TRINITY_DN3114_c0_g1_i9.p1  ORF type:complete len:239 (+),score=23.13 TRINITY_DN3114_c0_g1_i9:797-1513(+)